MENTNEMEFIFDSRSSNESFARIYADYFTGNSARYEWQFAYSDHSGKPELKDNAMLFSGAGIADFAMFQYTLPSKCDIYFTLEEGTLIKRIPTN